MQRLQKIILFNINEGRKLKKKATLLIILSIFLLSAIFVNAQIPLSKNVDISKKNHYDPSLLSLSNSAIVWIKTIGGNGKDICWSINKTSDGGFILIGETSSYDCGGGDAWLIKLNSEGNEQWNKTYGGKRGDYGFDGLQTKDGGYVIAGGTKTYAKGDHETWLVKTDIFGNEVWNKSYGGIKRDQGYAVIQVSDGGFVICGGSGSFTEGPNDYWVIKTDENGNEIWNVTYGDKGYDWGYDIIEGVHDELVFTGGTDTSSDYSHILDIGLITLDKNGQILWDKTFNKPPAKQRWDEGYSIIRTVENGFLIAGIAHTYHWFEDGEGDGWIIKTNENGEKVWDRIFGGDLCDGISTVKQTSDGGYILSGWTYSYGAGDADIWLLKIDDNGYVEWDITLGGEDFEWSMLHTLEIADDDSYMVAGTTDSFGVGGSDILLAKVKEPSIDIDFQGSFGFSFIVTNYDNSNINDLKWNIDISHTVLFGTNFQGSIDFLQAGESITIKNQGLIVGFGSGSIRFSIGEIGKTIQCLFLGPFVLRI